MYEIMQNSYNIAKKDEYIHKKLELIVILVYIFTKET